MTAEHDIKNQLIDHQIYLGGSRRMAERGDKELAAQSPIINDDTDWDFYATHTPELEAKLLALGWDHTNTSAAHHFGKIDYLDDEAVMILEKDNHQIVLRRDAQLYNRVFESIPVEYYYNSLWKGNPAVDRTMVQPIFNLMFAVARGMQRNG